MSSFVTKKYKIIILSDSIHILAIESSCDDTSAAVISNGKILANEVAGQKVHELYGGVVPELASRAHQQNIVPVVAVAMKKAGLEFDDLSAVAYTQGPGLMGSLLVGSGYAKGLAIGLDVPLIPINHMDAHVMAHFIDEPTPEFPFLCLVVSGGHTQLVRVEADFSMTIIGKTKDDAAGEAFDKTAKMLGLPYPGGPLVDAYAQKGNPLRFSFPKAKMPGYDFSFSGLKTAILYFLKEKTAQEPDFISLQLADICASVQHTIVSYLLDNLAKAARDLNIKNLGIAGGVSANTQLRQDFLQLGKTIGAKAFIPKFEYCTDNAAMIAITADKKFRAAHFGNLFDKPYAR